MVARAEHNAMHPQGKLDLIANLGCGTRRRCGARNQTEASHRAFWKRLLDAGESLMEGQRAWNDYTSICSRDERRNRLYRLDIAVDRLPELDDAASIPSLRSLVHNDSCLRKAITDFAEHLFATLFCFEITEVPISTGDGFLVTGRICCLRPGDDPAAPKIVQRLAASAVTVNGKSVKWELQRDEQGCIYQRMSFVSGEKIDIRLSEKTGKRQRRISGAPYSLGSLVRHSALQADFGTRVPKRKVTEEPPGPAPRPKKLMTCHGCR
ncbi:hypothetical protein LEL_11004 [Akanthomyces lecanii RCEF 1005]|uniref:Uncharacterized protein n=1 Tax=Akanthomyces lecanii RCEF 1005 TaxID=1081108 RepID=A0A162IB11_CORDF|nr:hypothetical protein LEL_11004 [Akanthomyces lecanii RCEF 1005]